MQHHHEVEDHDRGLAHDLKIIEQRMMGRRRALAWFATAGTGALLAGCGGSDSDTSSTSSSTLGTSTATTATTTTTTGTTTTGTTTGTTSGGTCVVAATETNGPYPADGTNTSRGSTSNALTASGIVRQDIRSSFLNSVATVAAGVQLTLTITIVNVNAACAPLAGYAVYLWHCDKDGNYSLYDLPNESYLRGMQVTDANGQVTFTTIIPGCYAGRYPHIHFEVFSSLGTATSGRFASLISQLAIPAEVCRTVYNGSSLYTSSVSRFAQTSIANDNVFGDNSSAQMASMTPTMSGSIAAGYTGTATIGLAR